MDQVLEQLTLEHSLGELLAPYNLSDMAMDCLAVLDALEIEQAQVIAMRRCQEWAAELRHE